MKYTDFEKHIKNTFTDASASVDTDALLAGLSLPIIPEPQSKKKGYIWIYGIIGLLLISSAYLLWSSQSDQSSHTASVNNITSPQNSTNSNNTYKANAINRSIESTTVQNNESNNKTQELSSEKVILSKSEISNQQLNSTNIAREEIVNPTKNNFDKSQFIVSKETESKQTINQFVGQNTLQIASDVTSANDIVLVDKEMVAVENQKRDKLELLEELPRQVYEVAPLAVRNDIPEPECPSFSKKSSWTIAAMIEGGYMFPQKDLSGESEVLQMRESFESSKEGLELGIHGILRKKNKPWYVRAGISYTRIAEQMRESYMYTERDTSYGIISITQSQSGDTITAIYGDVITETTFSGMSTRHYYLHLWDVPLVFGYEYNISPRLYAGAEIGANLNIRTGGSGLIFRDVNLYDDFGEVASSNTSVGMSYLGGLHLGYRLDNKSSLRLSARMRYYPSSFKTNIADIDQKYQLLGAHLGYVRHF